MGRFLCELSRRGRNEAIEICLTIYIFRERLIRTGSFYTFVDSQEKGFLTTPLLAKSRKFGDVS